MAYNHLPSMAKLLANPRLNYFMIRSLNNHYGATKELPGLMRLYKEEPKTFDDLSLQMYKQVAFKGTSLSSCLGTALVMLAPSPSDMPVSFLSRTLAYHIPDVVSREFVASSIRYDIFDNMHHYWMWTIVPCVGVVSAYHLWNYIRISQLMKR